MKEIEMNAEQFAAAAEYSRKLKRLEEIFASGSIDVIRNFLTTKEANIRLPHGRTFLHFAATNPDPRVISFFVAQGLNPDQEMVNGITPVLIAAHHANVLGVVSLLKLGANPYKKDTFGEDVLASLQGAGVDSGTLESIKALIANTEKNVPKLSSPSSLGKSSFAMYGTGHSSDDDTQDALSSTDTLPSTPLLRFGCSPKKKNE